MDARKGLDDDGDATEVARLERRVLARRPFPVVLVTYHDPLEAVLLVGARDVGHAAKVTAQHVVDLRATTGLESVLHFDE